MYSFEVRTNIIDRRKVGGEENPDIMGKLYYD
jgi:hypothetical protein